jgi:hypothetical protein
MARTQFFLKHPDYWQRLEEELRYLVAKAQYLGMTPAVRLNGTSDIPWEAHDRFRRLVQDYPTIKWYDYTKLYYRARPHQQSIYHLTFSRAENTPDDKLIDLLSRGYNVAIVFRSRPEQWHGYPVIDGDQSDLRFLDPTGVVVGLKAKGRAKHDVSGFVL